MAVNDLITVGAAPITYMLHLAVESDNGLKTNPDGRLLLMEPETPVILRMQLGRRRDSCIAKHYSARNLPCFRDLL